MEYHGAEAAKGAGGLADAMHGVGIEQDAFAAIEHHRACIQLYPGLPLRDQKELQLLVPVPRDLACKIIFYSPIVTGAGEKRRAVGV